MPCWNLEDTKLAIEGLKILLAVGAMYVTYRHFSASRGATMMARFSSRDCLEARNVTDAFIAELQALQENEKKIEKCRELCRQFIQGASPESIAKFNHIHAVGMFFGEIGFCYGQWPRLIRGREFDIFNRLLPYYWKRLEPFIIACHDEFKLALQPDGKPMNLKIGKVHLYVGRLRFFDKFRQGYKFMIDRGIAIEPEADERVRTEETKETAAWAALPTGIMAWLKARWKRYHNRKKRSSQDGN
jgi:hypothetical protein